jgi:hypothetical protein
LGVLPAKRERRGLGHVSERREQKQRRTDAVRYAKPEHRRAPRSQPVIVSEADFNATMNIVASNKTLNIYVSIKNRANTMGGQDWPKAIGALEGVARSDRNRSGPYICVFGITIDKGQRQIRRISKTKAPYSVNTEVWLSDFFWPFFANYTYAEIAKAVFEVLMETSPKEQAAARKADPRRVDRQLWRRMPRPRIARRRRQVQRPAETNRRVL